MNGCDQNSIFTYQQPIIIPQKYFFEITDLSLLICHTVSLVDRIPGLLDDEEGLRTFEMSGTIYPKTQLNNPENLSLQQHG